MLRNDPKRDKELFSDYFSKPKSYVLLETPSFISTFKTSFDVPFFQSKSKPLTMSAVKFGKTLTRGHIQNLGLVPIQKIKCKKHN